MTFSELTADWRNKIVVGDCLDVMKTLPDNSIDAVVTDPPYFRVKDNDWDRQWASGSDYLAWLSKVADEWKRILKSNGSLYCFASPDMSARVEVMLGERFNILNNIIWRKSRADHVNTTGRLRHTDASALRSYFTETERIIFAEHYGADNSAKGEAGYIAKCDDLRGFIFEPLRAYLASERDRAGVTNSEIVKQWQKIVAQVRSLNA